MLCFILFTGFAFVVDKRYKNMNFHSKPARPPTVISGNHSNWSIPTYLKMRAKDKRTATENIRCWCSIWQEKNSEKPHSPPLPKFCQILPTIRSQRWVFFNCLSYRERHTLKSLEHKFSTEHLLESLSIKKLFTIIIFTLVVLLWLTFNYSVIVVN